MVSFVCWYREDIPISLGRNNYGLAEQQAVLLLLKDVPVWYELWRNINGFPPDYYQPSKDAAAKIMLPRKQEVQECDATTVQ